VKDHTGQATVWLRLLQGGAGKAISGEPAHQGRGAAHRSQHRQAAGVGAQVLLSPGFRLGKLRDPCVFGEPLVRRLAERTIGLAEKHGRRAEGRSFNVSAGGNWPPCPWAIDHEQTHKAHSHREGRGAYRSCVEKRYRLGDNSEVLSRRAGLRGTSPSCRSCCGDRRLIWQNDTYGATADVTKGHGEFIGTTLESGTDREQRGDARSVCEAIIREAADASELPGRGVAKIPGRYSGSSAQPNGPRRKRSTWRSCRTCRDGKVRPLGSGVRSPVCGRGRGGSGWREKEAPPFRPWRGEGDGASSPVPRRKLDPFTLLHYKSRQ
jgi:hypothetical protein